MDELRGRISLHCISYEFSHQYLDTCTVVEYTIFYFNGVTLDNKITFNGKHDLYNQTVILEEILKYHNGNITL